jgi:hypothetical protein
VFNPRNEEGRRGKWLEDAVRSSGQRLHGGQGWGALGGDESRWRGCSPASVRKEEEEAGWAEWAKKAKQAGWRLGRKMKRIYFLNKNWIIEYIKALQICTRRFKEKI